MSRKTVEHRHLTSYKIFYDNAPIGFFAIRVSDGVFIRMNRFCEQLLAVERPTDSSSAYDYFEPSTKEQLIEYIKIHGRVVDFEMQIFVNEKSRWVSLAAQMCRQGNCIEGSMMDITEKKLMQIEIENLKKKEIQTLEKLQKDILKKLKEMRED